jgi:hypothetical protein
MLRHLLAITFLLVAFGSPELTYANDPIPFPLIPFPELTPGDLCTTDNRDFVEFRYDEQIPYCRRRVSFSHRQRIYDMYEIPQECRHRYTIDHFVPLAIGGSNADENLWPEHEFVKQGRPQLEFHVFLDLRDGHLTQKKAIDIIVEAKISAVGRLQKENLDPEDPCDIPEPVRFLNREKFVQYGN